MVASESQIETAVIPAAGRGVRLRADGLDRELPKALTPIGKRALIDFALETIDALSIRRVVVVVSPGEPHDLVRAHIEESRWSNQPIRLVNQPRPDGLAAAVAVAEPYIVGAFAVVLGDDITRANALDIAVHRFLASRKDALQFCVRETDPARISQSCALTFDRSFTMTSIVEKPSTRTGGYRGIGVYAFRRSIFRAIRATAVSPVTHQFELSDTLRSLARRRRVMAYPIDGRNINVNTPRDASEALALVASIEGTGIPREAMGG